MNNDFLCERFLSELDTELHSKYKNSVFAIDRLLANYKAVFPYFTNHTFAHSEQVINYCNMIAGENNISLLNADELYILLMGASLHDLGMGISIKDFSEMRAEIPEVDEYEQTHILCSMGDLTRLFHQEFGAKCIRKYRELFEIPTDEHLYCINQIVRGHREMDFLDKNEFDNNYRLSNGNTVRLPYLAALVKISDELDVTADRNLLFDYSIADSHWSAKQRLCYKCHKSIKKIDFQGKTITFEFSASDAETYEEIGRIKEKIEKTFREFVEVVNTYGNFVLNQIEIQFKSTGGKAFV